MGLPLSLHFQSLTIEHAHEMISWRYPAPYELYNFPVPASSAVIENLLHGASPYLAVLDEHDRMVAFRCFGEEARVPGGDYSAEDTLDLGGGLRPDLTGQGLGRQIIAAAMNYGLERYSPRYFRTTVASFNLRALKTCERLGFRMASNFVRPRDGMEFVIMMRPADAIELAVPIR